MKRNILAMLLAGTLIAGTFAFAGCDSIAPSGGNTGDGTDETDQSVGGGTTDDKKTDDTTGGDASTPTAWVFDDDYHWHTQSDKAAHTRENGVCTVCGTNHTVGLSYQLASEASSARNAALLADYENAGGYYIVTGIGDATDGNVVIPETYNGLPVKEIADSAFSWLRGNVTDSRPDYKLNSVVLPKSIETIGVCAFNGSLVKVYYSGSKADFESVDLKRETGKIDHFGKDESGVLYFYTKSHQAEGTGYYWYYNNNGGIEEVVNYVGLKQTIRCYFPSIVTKGIGNEFWDVQYSLEDKASFTESFTNYMETEVEITSYNGSRFGAKISSVFKTGNNPDYNIGEWNLEWVEQTGRYSVQFFTADANICYYGDGEPTLSSTTVSFGADVRISVALTGKCVVNIVTFTIPDTSYEDVVNREAISFEFYMDIDKFSSSDI